MRLIFAGTPATAIPVLDALVDAGHDVALVLTREDAPVGRKKVMTPSHVAARADELGIAVLKANRFDDSVRSVLSAVAADLGVVVAYGALIPADVLQVPARGWLNLHFSALPDLRGAAPVQRALMRGDVEIGTTVFELVSALDAGPIYDIQRGPVGADETSDVLLERLARSGAQQVLAVISGISDDSLKPTAQEGVSTYAAKLVSEDGRFRPDESGSESYNRFRGVTSEPGMWFMDGETRVKILDARLSATRVAAGEIALIDAHAYLGTTSVALELLEVQPAGRVTMKAADWARGRARESS